MDSTDLAFTSALEQARLIRQKEISPLELTQLYLDRIQRINPTLNSYLTVMAERAIADAKAKTEQLSGGTNLQIDPEELPPFFGVPISIKDLTPIEGVPCSYGIKVLKDRIAEADDGVVSRIRDAGFVMLGKTSTPELGSTPYTEPKGFPPARNPWNPDYTPGGSSGGAAASVAAGLCAIAQGTDGGGSIRGPAFCCGLVGIKPSRGRISNAPTGDKLSGLATDGPLAHTVADAAALLDVMSGYVIGDPYWLPDPNPSFLAATERSPGSLRVAFLSALPPAGQFHPVCEKAVLDTVRLLESMGHCVEEIEINLTDLVDPFAVVWQAGSDLGVPGFFMGKFNRWLLRRSRRRSGGDYLRAVGQVQAIARRLITQLDRFDVLVLPTYMHPTIRVGEWAKLPPKKIFENIVNWIAPCPPFNATGQPVIAFPTGFDTTGLPIGVQLVGRPAAEETLLSLAARLEEAQTKRDRRPAIAIQ